MESSQIIQADSSLGGDAHLPHSVEGLKFVAARCKELSAMTENLLSSGKTKLIFQSLPVQMRRRIMSHNSKRLPRRLREAHMSQMRKSGLPPQQKRPSRKHRRRPRNLLSEYHRRQRKNAWLETHIWHAKRFHMTDRWGFKLAESSCDKTYRSCYRATARHCLLQDISYNGCIEIKANIDEIINKFKLITSLKCGLGIGSKGYLDGKREGSIDLFHINSYPYRYVGRVKFMWNPLSESHLKTLWLFVHASCYNEVVELLINCFNLRKRELMTVVPMDDQLIEDGSDMKSHYQTNVDVEKTKFALKKSLVTVYENNEVVLIELKHTLNRFKLTGPLSQAVLTKTLDLLHVSDSKITHTSPWMSTCNENILKQSNEIQSKYWRSISTLCSPSELPRHMIIGLVVKDPRLNRPKKRRKALPEEGGAIVNARELLSLNENLCMTYLWDAEVRNSIADAKVSVAHINQLINKYGVVSGDPCKEFNTLQAIPIALIQNPGSNSISTRKLGFGCGWDVIVPASYGMPFWLSLILCGARPGALKETVNMTFEQNEVFLYPDSKSYRDEADRVYNIKREYYFKLPPNKRVNYAKMSVASPLKCQWARLLSDWKGSPVNDFFVCREKETLRKIQQYLQSSKPKEYEENSECLIAVKLTVVGSGRLRQFALICLPRENDLNSLMAPVEPKARDRHSAARIRIRKEHKLQLRTIRRRRVRTKRKAMMTSKTPLTLPKSDNSKLNKEYLLKMQELWMPKDAVQVRNQCSREVFGFVTHGDFSLAEAKCLAVGFITLQGLDLLTKRPNRRPTVIVRNINSRQYRFAELEVLDFL